MILHELHLLQERHGYLPENELWALAERLRVPLHRIHEVASYYPHYRLRPGVGVEVRVCRDLPCCLRGADSSRTCLTRATAGESLRIEGVSCLGQCDRAPAVSINGQVAAGLTPDELLARVRAAVAGQPLPPTAVDRSSPGWRIDPYPGQARYEAVRRYREAPDPEGLLRELETAGLRGMGGAGFPTHRKWAAVRGTPAAVKYVIGNADESEPGTFKDRELLRRTPYLVIEGAILAGLVTGARQGFICIRHEYQAEIAALTEALGQARADGPLRPDQGFTLDLFVSPGGYIQGEESALLEAMEDRRGEPRNKPPFPVTSGLFGRPTVINNVETLAWVPVIALRSGAWYRDQGVHGATGLRFVSVSGDVARPGAYEVPLGQTVRELILETAGGLRDGQRLQAIAPSGPSGGFLPARIPVEQLPRPFAERMLQQGQLAPEAQDFDIMDLPLDFGTLAALGSMLGGAFIVVGDRANLLELALNCLEFYRNESCGKCVPCRLGTQKLVELTRAGLAAGLPPAQQAVVHDIAFTMAQTSICGLGQVAANPLLSVLKHFPAGSGPR